jgi:hypothetical protein
MKSELCANGVSPWRLQIRISISGDGRDLYLHCSSQTGCGTHPSSGIVCIALDSRQCEHSSNMLATTAMNQEGHKDQD